MRQVLVIGGGGFVGSRVARALARGGWARPIVASRSAPAGTDDNLAWRVCDLTQPDQVAAALRDIDCVVNCADPDPADARLATDTLLHAARRAGTGRVVHLSSMAVYDAETGILDEGAKLVAPDGSYAGGKAAAEAAAAAHAADGADLVVLRPSCIYGPGSEQWTGRIGRLLLAGRLGDLGAAGNGACNLIHVDDVVDAALTALRRPDIAGECFNVSSPEIPSWNNYLLRFGRAIDARLPRRVPSWRLQLEARLLAPAIRLANLTGQRMGRVWRSSPESISPGLLRGMTRQIRLDHRKADQRLHFRRTRLDDGLRDAAAWVRAERDRQG